MNYQEALDWLYATQHFGIKLGLDAPKRLLREYLAFPPRTTKVAHVAGSNGKGSTCAILDSITRTAGIKTGLFTSPHLVDFRERIRVNGEMISEEETARHITELKELVKDWEHHPTFFELTLAIGMRFFRDSGCEIIILETGMGGRLDATTAVPADIHVITPIAMDHAQWLGDTIEKIAAEKAGIITSSSPVICSKQVPSALGVIAEKANEMQASLTTVTEPIEGYSLSLHGSYQKENAAVALEAAHQLGIQLRYDTVKYALLNVKWQGRFEVISENPLVVIDGAHNPHSAGILAETWAENYPDIKPMIIYGAVESKDLNGVCEHLTTISDSIIFTPINSPRTVHFEDISRLHALSAVKLYEKSNIQEALNFASEQGFAILITGSLYLLGEYKALIRKASHYPTAQ